MDDCRTAKAKMLEIRDRPQTWRMARWNSPYAADVPLCLITGIFMHHMRLCRRLRRDSRLQLQADDEFMSVKIVPFWVSCRCLAGRSMGYSACGAASEAFDETVVTPSLMRFWKTCN